MTINHITRIMQNVNKWLNTVKKCHVSEIWDSNIVEQRHDDYNGYSGVKDIKHFEL